MGKIINIGTLNIQGLGEREKQGPGLMQQGTR